MIKKLIFLLKIATIISATCSNNGYSYGDNCYSSCENINMFKYAETKTCVPSCKSLHLPMWDYECHNCYNTLYLMSNPNDMNDFCVGNCVAFEKMSYSMKCVNNCKAIGLIKRWNECTDNCVNSKYISTQNEDYCVSDCRMFGLYKHWPCVKNCKAIGKYLYEDECIESCPYTTSYYYTEEENYCIYNCYYHDLVKQEGTNKCVESCKSVEMVLGYSRGVCQASYSAGKMITYNNEDYMTSDCALYDRVIGPSNICVKSCKAVGKVRKDYQCYNSCTNGNSYEDENENYCLSDSQCRNIGRYPINLNNVYICSEECTGSNCNSECGENQYYSIPDKKCVDSCRSLKLFLYNDKYCIKTCPIFSPNVFKGTKEDICTKDCPEEAPYLNYDSGVCIANCDDYIFDGNKCLTSCPNPKQYVNIIDNKKYCVNNCHEFGLYNLLNEMTCTDNCKKYMKYLAFDNCFKACPIDAPYVYEGEDEYKCFKNCSEIGLLTDLGLNRCTTNCKNTGKKLLGTNCVSSCPITDKYIYSTDEEEYCVPSCALYNQKSILSPSASSDIPCIGLSCKEQNYFLFNNMCMNCPSSFTFKVYGEDENFCTMKCEEYGLVASFSTLKCVNDISLDSCESTKFKDFLNKQCADKCPDEIPFVKNGVCVKQCEKFYYEDTQGNKICTNDCSGKYILVKEGKCISSCDEINNYQLNGYNICFSKCNEHSLIQRHNFLTKDIFSSCVESCQTNDNTKEENECIKECLMPFKFRLEDDSDKKCYQTCKELNKHEYIDEDGNYLCVDNCKQHNKVLYDNQCLDKCPKDKRIKSEKSGDYICKENCEDGQYLNYNIATNEYSCVNNCKDLNLILDENSCVSQCPKERPFIVDELTEKKCSGSCLDNQFLNTDSSKTECVNSCNSVNKLIDGKTCVNSCPNLKRFRIIKGDEIYCSSSCDAENKYINEENNEFICVKSCKSIGKVLNNGNCLKTCPDNKKIEIEINGEIECSNQCEENKYLLEQADKNICVSDCKLYNKMEFERKCISDCPNGKYLYENLETNQKICIDDCSIHNLYSNDNKCVENCEIYDKFIYEGTCLSNCPDDFQYTLNGVCKSDPCEDGKFYDVMNKKCLVQCDAISKYKNVENNYCVNSCKGIKSDKIYSIYENTCISNCNEQNKYLYLFNEEYYCIDNCKERNLFISEDGKFCVEKCETDTPYRNKGQCAKDCGDLYINNNECVENCPDSLPYFYNNKCVDSCYDNFLYEIYNTNICVDSCSINLILNANNKPKYYLENYNNCLKKGSANEKECNMPFYLVDRENRICYQNCSQAQNSYIYDNQECVRTCPYGIKEENICAEKNEDCSQQCFGNYLYFNLLIFIFGFLLVLN